ncbi:hypothetical protein KsCSTR_12320 [Candidatus Kuenenia stuttgartiensis]|uniref:Uncharacterized protein n=1 Tax=Kuenenia stuttgartiensis TaxID=174633 RepID=Q1PY76_KUEST|nr:hypothetical protein KsCSTR_12320 [Candidatus Kuenenia stuttgartiensis]CAJ72040.1 unknown protein [Candidatus Kuenenia stuttgartiensis]
MTNRVLLVFNLLLRLAPAQQNQDQYDNQHHPKNKAGFITPRPTIWPGWDYAQNDQNQSSD